MRARSDGGWKGSVNCQGAILDDQSNLGDVRYSNLDNHFFSKGYATKLEEKQDNGIVQVESYLCELAVVPPADPVFVFNEMKHDNFTRVKCFLIAISFGQDYMWKGVV